MMERKRRMEKNKEQVWKTARSDIKKNVNTKGEHSAKNGKKYSSRLQFDEDKQEMFCSVCREFPILAGKSSSFFKGSQAFHVGNIKAHGSCDLSHSYISLFHLY